MCAGGSLGLHVCQRFSWLLRIYTRRRRFALQQGTWFSGIPSVQHSGGPGFNPDGTWRFAGAVRLVVFLQSLMKNLFCQIFHTHALLDSDE
eukprot:2017993-Amphidinium_carterae.2